MAALDKRSSVSVRVFGSTVTTLVSALVPYPVKTIVSNNPAANSTFS
ncbi:hypothetical protein V1387_18300 [Allomuricauda taeanensis]|nr:hypothetical protein [Allomuricauda taeanensis]